MTMHMIASLDGQSCVVPKPRHDNDNDNIYSACHRGSDVHRRVYYYGKNIPRYKYYQWMSNFIFFLFELKHANYYTIAYYMYSDYNSTI